jgi:hypothetical protein
VSVIARNEGRGNLFLYMRLLRFTRNDILSNAFILVLFTSFVPENIMDIYLE